MKVTIDNFRGIRNVELNPLGRVNILTGKNGTGKTAILEALCILLGDASLLQTLPTIFRSGNFSASDNFENFWLWQFPEKSFENNPGISLFQEREIFSVSIEMEMAPGNPRIHLKYTHISPDESGKSQAVSSGNAGEFLIVRNGCGGNMRLGRPELAIISSRDINPIQATEKFNRLAARRGGEDKILDLMKVIQPRLQRLRYLKITEQPLIYADLKMQESVPFTQLGQGFEKLLSIYLELLTSKAKVLLVDEIENGLHKDVMAEVWRGLAFVAKELDVRIVATTHSQECVKAAHEACSEDEAGGFTHHRLLVEDGKVTVKTTEDDVLG